jgi:CRP-like cAMP-binding protein
MVAADLRNDNLEWLLTSTFLTHLSDPDQAAFLETATLVDYAAGDVIVDVARPTRGLDLIVRGEASVHLGAGSRLRYVCQLGPGHVFGERSVILKRQTNAVIRALSPIRALHIDAEPMQRLIEERPDLRRVLLGLVRLRNRDEELLSLLRADPVLRVLRPDELQRLLQTATLRDVRAGDRVIEAGSESQEVFVVVRGLLAVFPPTDAGPQGAPLTTEGRGALVGHRAALLKTPRSAHVYAESDVELLAIPGAAFVEILGANPVALRRLRGRAAPLVASGGDETPGGQVTVVYGSERRTGATTLAWAAFAGLRELQAKPPLLVDPDGAESARRLGLTGRPVTRGDVQAMEAVVDPALGARVMWPVRAEDLTALTAAVRAEADHIVVAAPAQLRQAEALGPLAQVFAFVASRADATYDVADIPGQFRIRVVRLGDGVDPPNNLRHVVRMPKDSAGADAFWRTKRLADLTSNATPFGRAGGRLARAVCGRSVGVALGGGGAWGFAHVGFLRALIRAGLPVDYLAGSSFGALVGAAYAAEGLAGLDRLEAARHTLLWWLAAAMFDSRAISKKMERMFGPRTLGSTEIPFLPVGTDIVEAGEMVPVSGSLGDGVRSSSGMPGVIAVRSDGRRIVDGGVINNVPASVVWDVGADFIVAANVIPRRPEEPGGGDAKGPVH